MNKLWLIPIISIIILVGAALAAQGSYNTGIEQNKQALTLSNINSVNNGSYGYNSIYVTGDLNSTKEFSYLQATVNWYDSTGKVLKTDSLAWNINNVEPGQTYQFKIAYFDQTTPSKAQIKITSGLGDSEVLLNKTVEIK